MSPSLPVSTPENLAQAFLYHGARLADLHGITPGELEAVYSKAHEDLGAGGLHDALESLAFLAARTKRSRSSKRPPRSSRRRARLPSTW